jgi:hypothetical protein
MVWQIKKRHRIYIITIKVVPLYRWEEGEGSECCKFFRNRCSSNIVAVGRSAGFLLKQSLKKSLPSGDKVSGIAGVSFITLNIAAACIIRPEFISVKSTSYKPKNKKFKKDVFKSAKQ